MGHIEVLYKNRKSQEQCSRRQCAINKKTDQRAGQKIVLLSNLSSIHLRAHINHGQADVLYRFFSS